MALSFLSCSANHLVQGTNLDFRAACRPFIGLAPRSDPYLDSFLRQQGYIVETASGPNTYAFYLDRPVFRHEEERALLRQIENDDFPLLRLGRWPAGARSALVITGDIDALTIWDYGLRLFGN